jgi:hypothetical protein
MYLSICAMTLIDINGLPKPPRAQGTRTGPYSAAHGHDLSRPGERQEPARPTSGCSRK